LGFYLNPQTRIENNYFESFHQQEYVSETSGMAVARTLGYFISYLTLAAVGGDDFILHG